jgi:transcription termination/antitermination protein NusG
VNSVSEETTTDHEPDVTDQPTPAPLPLSRPARRRRPVTLADEPAAQAGEGPADAAGTTCSDDSADDLDDLLGMAGAGTEPRRGRGAASATRPRRGRGTKPARPRRPRSLEDVRDQKDLARLLGDWYVVHTYSGYEQRVKDNLANRVEALEAEDRVFEVVIPTEEVTEYKKGKKTVSQKKFLPGYVSSSAR